MFICGVVFWCAGSITTWLEWTSYSRSDNHCRTYLYIADKRH